ncbi:MAG TPA: EscU/YscU/HrcU family type III secretion system export apparatus switch protein, partial [Pirellulales bacterium]|nr:EscU/YscU/HrcU family type III secretion system export apparatus switch protein [Pirellulales bacterium]
MAELDGDKTLDPTAHRRQQARSQGHVARSQDLSSSALLLGGLGALVFAGGKLVDYLTELLRAQLGGGGWSHWLGAEPARHPELIAAQWNASGGALVKVLFPLLVLATLVAIAINLAQTGFLFLPRKAAPDFSRINPLVGWTRLFSTLGAMRLGLAVFKIGGIAAVAYFSLRHEADQWASLSTYELPRIAIFAWQTCLWTCVKIGFALLAFALVDYGYQRWRFERDLRMTPQELREEMRNLQGDGQLAARRRTAQRQRALERLQQVAVPRADVVVSGADGSAVALRYDAASMRAPLLVARGSGSQAERIAHLA